MKQEPVILAENHGMVHWLPPSPELPDILHTEMHQARYAPF